MEWDVRDLGRALARGSTARRSTCNASVEMASGQVDQCLRISTTLRGIAGGTSPGGMRCILPEAFAHRIWPANASHMTTIRAEVARWLNDLSASPDTVNNVVLAVTEAAANCVEHAYHTITEHNTIEVTFWTEGSVICIQISDHGSWRPSPATINGQARGLTHMGELVESVMIRFGPFGTNVLLRQPVSITSQSRREGWSA